MEFPVSDGIPCIPILFPHLVEDTVKEQLEAAKPEPIIDEVVGKPGAGIPEVGIQSRKSGSGNPEPLRAASRLECCLRLSLDVSSPSLGSGKLGSQETRLVSACGMLLPGKGCWNQRGVPTP